MFPIIYDSEGSKHKFTKAASAEPTSQIKDEKKKKMRIVVIRGPFPN